MKINPSFEKWACSYSGYEGGGLKSNGIWLCGIEWGMGENGVREIVERDIQKDHSQFPSLTDEEFKSYFTGKWTQFSKKAGKLFTAINGIAISDYQKTCESIQLFQKDSATAKLNLYPMSCREADESTWEKWQFEVTGFPTKALYKAWCQENRFPLFQKLKRECKPKVIVCTGTSFTPDFLLAFSNPEMIFQPADAQIDVGSKRSRPCVHYDLKDGSHLFVIPFIGNWGLNSDEQIAAVGSWIRARVSKSILQNVS